MTNALFMLIHDGALDLPYINPPQEPKKKKTVNPPHDYKKQNAESDLLTNTVSRFLHSFFTNGFLLAYQPKSKSAF
jgi:hypothetical protein